ncbi:uncharacterized protein HD556DRAFT_1445194 [Suillus plorans]|uniref:Uncharacterized protein n=1 Tax=Suillus plorans TaxID=116603 RepID=A0A9P7DF14_9AGAM|nr:uncharacterized protein HD556DRAFT_1445194 [Suillus plorans]KAG1791563.1 hypothetical protein HD556DRAFT_1445194 [Suillus plorans]
MNDANGGEGKLRGLVENVPLSCGAVHTKANLYVGDHVPFNLLLGRPWQRGNYVSIDERQDGTWLVFKDPQNVQATHEMLCTPDGINPEWVFEPSTWLGSKFPSSFMIFDEEMVIDSKSEMSNFDLPMDNMAGILPNTPVTRNSTEISNFCGLHNPSFSKTQNILEESDIIGDVTALDHQFEFIPTLYGIKAPRNHSMKNNPPYSLSQNLQPAHLPNLEIRVSGMQNATDSLSAILGTAGSYQLSLNSQNSKTLTLQLHPVPSATSPSHKSLLPSPVSTPIQPATAKTGWEESFSSSGDLDLTYPDDAGPFGDAAKLEEGGDLVEEEHNATLHNVLDPTTIYLPTPSVPPLAHQVLCAPATPTPTPAIGPDPTNSPSLPALDASAMDCEPPPQVLTAINVLPEPPPQVFTALNVLSPTHTTYPTSTILNTGTATTSFPNPFAPLPIPTPHLSEAAWRPVSPLSTSSTISDHPIPQPYNEKHVRTSVDSPSNELWIDARRVVHVTTIPDGPHQVPFINQVRVLEAPAKSIRTSPPPPYVSHRADANATHTTTILPVPDNHQYLLDYFATDLPTTSDHHTPMLDKVANAYQDYTECQDNLCALDWDSRILSTHPFVDEVTESFPSAGPRSERDWEDRAQDLLDHRVHSRALIAMLEDNILSRMLEEGLRRPGVLACDPNQRIGTHVPPTHYQAEHPPINPFFTLDETDYLSSLAAVADFHGEHRLATSVEAALLMPYPDPDIVHALVQEGMLDGHSESQVISFARARDRALGIQRVCLFMVAYHPFRSSTLADTSQLRFTICYNNM